MITFDARWVGAHGIGRFAGEIFRRVPGLSGIDIGGRPSAPIDPWRLGIYLRRRRPDLFFSPGYNVPIGGRCPYVVTVHDLNHLFIKENSSISKRIYYESILKPGLRCAERVLTVSEFSRRQLLEWSGIGAERVTVVRPGISEVFTESGSKHVDNKPYLLYVGNGRPHKNFERAVTAYAISGLSASLMLISTGRATAGVEAIMEKHGLTDIQFVGEVTDDGNV